MGTLGDYIIFYQQKTLLRMSLCLADMALVAGAGSVREAYYVAATRQLLSGGASSADALIAVAEQRLKAPGLTLEESYFAAKLLLLSKCVTPVPPATSPVLPRLFPAFPQKTSCLQAVSPGFPWCQTRQGRDDSVLQMKHFPEGDINIAAKCPLLGTVGDVSCLMTEVL